MLGNFSFGDYFKRGAIEYAWEYMTEVLALPKDRIWITVHPEDDESPSIWREVIRVPAERIVQDKTNWWGPVGPSGPCGPDTELYLDTGEEQGCGRSDCGPLCECGRFNELWNLVFQIYNKTEEGELEPLPKASGDTGMGFERVAAVMQGVPSIFETDLLAPIMSAVVASARKSNPKLSNRLNERQDHAARVIADHVRGLAFLLADGFTPSNEGAGYVLRRVIRRAYRFGRHLGVEEPFLHGLVPAVADTMGDAYPELREAQQRITTWLEQEEKQFEETLERCMGPLVTAIERAQAAGLKVLPGEDAFRLHDTYGLPKELAADMAAENGLALDDEGFERAMQEQRERGRAGAEEDFASGARSGYQDLVGKTSFLGYEGCSAESSVVGILKDGQTAESVARGEEAEVFLDQTPFYAESGGQVGDRGRLETKSVKAEVLDTYYPVEGAQAHRVRVEKGEIKVGQRLTACVDEERRQAIARAHTATHLLHCMLRQVLGEHAAQSGSLVDADRLRFDFSHFAAVTEEERKRIEEGVLRLALQDDELVSQEMDLAEAREMGATALFGEKYGERVRVVQVGGFSKELCGGTHLVHASAVGGFAIVSEGSIGAGLRRMEAVTGKGAHALAVRYRESVSKAAEELGCGAFEIDEAILNLEEDLRAARRRIARLEQKDAATRVEDLAAQAVEVDGVKLVAARVEGLGPEALRSLRDQVRDRRGSGIGVFGCESKGRVQFRGAVSKDLVSAGYHAGNLIREVAKIAGGGGGGRPDFAQAGGKNPERLDEALAKVKELVAAQGR